MRNMRWARADTTLHSLWHFWGVLGGVAAKGQWVGEEVALLGRAWVGVEGDEEEREVFLHQARGLVWVLL